MQFDINRRRLVQGLLALTALAIFPLRVLARNAEAFEATSPDDALKSLFGDKTISDSDEVSLKVPDIAENGAVVPVTVESSLAGVNSISIIVVENPNPLSARFQMNPAVVANISTRIKMGQSSDVVAAVETDKGVFVTRKNVKVTIGGCGG
jgi:sulfur-oxidizing protein SoxY